MGIPCDFDPLGTVDGELPPGYERLKAVRFPNQNGAVYPNIVAADTGVPATENTVVVADMSVNSNSQGGYCGVYPRSGRQVQFGYDAGTLNAYAFEVKRLIPYDSGRHVFKIDIPGRISAVDEHTAIIPLAATGYTTAPLHIFLGARYENTQGVTAALDITLYQFAIYEGDTIRTRLIPCINKALVCTLFDTVSRRDVTLVGNKQCLPVYYEQ